MSPKQRAEQQSGGTAVHEVDVSGARGGRRRDGRLTSGSDPVVVAGYEARLVTWNSRTTVAGRLNGRSPDSGARLTRNDVGGRLAEPVAVPGGRAPRWRRCTGLSLVVGVVVSF